MGKLRFAGALTFVVGALIHAAAHAQRADDNAVTAAEDAFGATLGDESIGPYSATQVRGFSPVAAGNVRIEGVYVDRRATLPTRLVEGSSVRVGVSAQGYPFPAPTGIVDYRLQKTGDQRVVSVAAGLDPYAAPSLEVDAKFPDRSRPLRDGGGRFLWAGRILRRFGCTICACRDRASLAPERSCRGHSVLGNDERP